MTRYAVLEPQGDAEAIATVNGDVVAVRTGRLTWWGLSLSEGFGDVAPPGLVLPMLQSHDVESPFFIAGDKLLAFRRTSKLGGSLIFLFNLEPTVARARVKPNWQITKVTDLIEKKEVPTADGSFEVGIPPGMVKLFYCRA